MSVVLRSGNSSSKTPITFNVSRRTVKGKVYYEATVNLTGFNTTKLKRVDSNCTLFATTQAIVSACKARANQFNCSANIVFPTTTKTNKTNKKRTKA